MPIKISNTDDIIDSRDVIARIEELEAERDEYEAARAESTAMMLSWEQQNEDEAAELAALCALRDQGDDSPDWQYGETLIRDSYFRDYAQELAENCGDVIWAELRWPLTCIDWAQAARELRMDYTPVDFDGVTYWIRS